MRSLSSDGFAVHQSIPACWEDLTRGFSPLSWPAWLRSQSPRLGGAPLWIVLTRNRSPAVGFFGVVVEAPRNQPTTDLHALMTGEGSIFAGEPGSGPDQLDQRLALIPKEEWFPNLLVTYPGYDSFLVGPESLVQDSCEQLIQLTLEWAHGQGLAAVGFPYVSREQTALRSALACSGFSKVDVTVRAQLVLPGISFEDYLSFLPPERRRKVRRERQRMRQASLQVEAGPLANCVGDVARLRCAHRRKYGYPCEEAVEQASFKALADSLPDELTVFRCLSRDRAISMALFLRDGDRWIAIVSGTDYGHPAWRFVYFETVFYRAIESAYDRGLRRISYGMTDADAKRRRGCDLSPVEGWIKLLR